MRQKIKITFLALYNPELSIYYADAGGYDPDILKAKRFPDVESLKIFQGPNDEIANVEITIISQTEKG